MAEREFEFRKLVLSLSQHLIVTETDQIVYLYNLPLEYCGKPPLTVLHLMHNRDFFSATKPDGLARVMKHVNRMDLVETVKVYSRSTKLQRKISKSRSSHKSSTLDESDPSFYTSFQAKLEVAEIQSTITAESLVRALDEVKGTKLKRVEEIMLEAKTYSDKLPRLIKHAKALYQMAMAGPGSSDEEAPLQKPNTTLEQRALPEEPSSSDDDDIYSSADIPGMKECKEGSDSDSDLYTPLYNIEVPQGDQQAQLVTGQTEKRPRPPTHPKPVKQKTEGGPGGESGSGPRGVPILPQPVFTEMRNRRSSLKRTDPHKQSVADRDATSSRDKETADYTGGSTGDYAYDSGFCDVRSLRREPPTPKPSKKEGSEVPSTGESRYYKTLGTPDPVNFYMTVQRSPPDGLQSLGGQEECPYMNVQHRQLQT